MNIGIASKPDSNDLGTTDYPEGSAHPPGPRIFGIVVQSSMLSSVFPKQNPTVRGKTYR